MKKNNNKDVLKKKNDKFERGNLCYLYYKDYFKDYYMNDENVNENYFEEKNSNIIKSSKKNKITSENKLEFIDQTFVLKTIYPGLLIGSGYSHIINNEDVFKLGLEFDYTTGLPIINGSSVKGLLRSMFYVKKDKSDPDFEENNKKNIAKLDYINSILKTSIKDKKVNVICAKELHMNTFEQLTDEIFEGKKDNKPLNIYDRDIFFDAVIDVENTKAQYILGEDYITPHKNPIKNPTPIKFLKVMPDVAWCFQFDLKKGILSKEQKKELFKSILIDLGIGAKTNVGYGALVD